jgi:hypothetical protein
VNRREFITLLSGGPAAAATAYHASLLLRSQVLRRSLQVCGLGTQRTCEGILTRLFNDPQQNTGLRHGLTIADRQRPVGIGVSAYARRHCSKCQSKPRVEPGSYRIQNQAPPRPCG